MTASVRHPTESEGIVESAAAPRARAIFPAVTTNSAALAGQLVAQLGTGEERTRAVDFGFRHLRKILERWPEASDIHVRCEKPVRIQLGSRIESYTEIESLSAIQATGFILALHRCRSGSREFAGDELLAREENAFLKQLGASQKAEFSAKGDAFLVPDMPSGRLRVHCFWDQNGIACTARILHDHTPPLESLGFEDDTIAQLRKLTLRKGGIAFVTGQTGNGKSTTLAALAQWILDHHSRHIVTIEDPIEYVLNDAPTPTRTAACLVTQQEVGDDVRSFCDGVVDVLRKHPDIVILGECRTRETMEAALTCADTGHFVLATLHTRDAVSTLSRIIKLFGEHEREGILQQLSESLCFVLSQGLLPRADEPGRKSLCYEFLVNDDPASRSAIVAYARDPTSLRSWMNNARNVAWNRCLERLRASGSIARETYDACLIRHASGAP